MIGVIDKLVSGVPPRAVHDNRGLMQRATKSELRRTVAERLLKAREMNGWTQTEAATRFGYSTPAQLSQWEQRKRMPPLHMLIRACDVYRVSLDYIMGLSEEPDRDPQTAERLMILRVAQESMTDMSHQLCNLVMEQTKRGGPTMMAAHAYITEGERLAQAFKRFVELNPEFEDMRGGNTLAVAAESFEKNGLAHAQSIVDRHHRINKDATAHVVSSWRTRQASNQSLFDFPEAPR